MFNNSRTFNVVRENSIKLGIVNRFIYFMWKVVILKTLWNLKFTLNIIDYSSVIKKIVYYLKMHLSDVIWARRHLLM